MAWGSSWQATCTQLGIADHTKQEEGEIEFELLLSLCHCSSKTIGRYWEISNLRNWLSFDGAVRFFLEISKLKWPAALSCPADRFVIALPKPVGDIIGSKCKHEISNLSKWLSFDGAVRFFLRYQR